MMQTLRDFLGVSVLTSLPCNAGNVGLILGRGTKIPHAAEQLSPSNATTEPACVPRLENVLQRSIYMPQLRPNK